MIISNFVVNCACVLCSNIKTIRLSIYVHCKLYKLEIAHFKSVLHKSYALFILYIVRIILHAAM